MCMGYANDIRAWVCPQEIGRREQVFARWGELLGEGDASATAPVAPACRPAQSPQGEALMRPTLIQSLDA